MATKTSKTQKQYHPDVISYAHLMGYTYAYAAKLLGEYVDYQKFEAVLDNLDAKAEGW